MASISLSTPVPAHSPFGAAPDIIRPTNPIHSRRISRNRDLVPLPAFTFNPGATGAMKNIQESSPAAAGAEGQVDANEPVRTSPPALPAFSFNPGATVQTDSGSSSPTHPILEEMARNKSRRTFKAAASPPFTFNPVDIETQKTPSPTKSCFPAETPSSARSIVHRRGANDFIGTGEEAQASNKPHFGVSPQKMAHGLPVTGYGATRSAHQHRRSKAISITEIETSELIKAHAVAKHRAGSVPSTPSDLALDDHFSRASQSIPALHERTPPRSPDRRASTTGARPRVGFADTVDVIPRPLSMISSETEGSSSTVRGNHSLTGSISSLGSPVALSTTSPVYNERTPVHRPRTADATTSSQQTPIWLDISGQHNLPKRPLSASDSPSLLASSGSPVSKKRFWFASGGSNDTSPKTTPRSTPTLEQIDPMSRPTAFAPTVQMAIALTRPKASPERKANIKKRKVRTIAGAIFSRKARSRPAQSRGRCTSTLPPLSRPNTENVVDTVFDEDNTVVIASCHSPGQERPKRPFPNTEAEVQSLPSGRGDGCGDLVTSPVIDLDAALGPFGSEERLPRTGFAAARSRMHSSMGRTMPDAFGVLHRRAESAPQMPPINKTTFCMHRPGSNTDVAEDVFDEEEEDVLAEESEPRGDFWPKPEHGGGQDTNASGSLDCGSALKADSPIPSPSMGGLAISMDAPDAVEIVDVEEDMIRDTARSSDSTLSATPVPGHEIKESASSTITFAYPAPPARYASSGEGRSAPGSVISSPDPDHTSFDNYPRLGRHLGEPIPDADLQSLTEDVPSLCDSVSTGNAPRFSSGTAMHYSADQRSESFPAPAMSQNQHTWKRASLASLNRLIPGSSHGEKSRLRFEEPVESEQEGKARKRGNRISRLMSFWRTKERVQ